MVEIGQKSNTIQIENIEGLFHIFNQFGTPIIYHSLSLWTAVLPSNIYERILSSNKNDAVYTAAINYIRNYFISVPTAHKKVPIRRIPSITLTLTHSCNLECPYCFDRFSSSGRMEYTTAIQAVRSFAEHHKRFRVIFFGGEPLLEFSLLKRIVGFCEKLYLEGYVEDISYCITTNGTILNETIVRFFNAYDFDVTLSVDGVFSDLLNQVVGSPPKILRTDLFLLYQRLKKLYIRVSVYPHTINHIRDIYMELQILRPLVIAFSPIIDNEFAFTKKDEISWNRQMDSIIYQRVAGSCGCRINAIDVLVNSVIQGVSVRHGCSADEDSFAIDVDGTKYPCHRFVGKTSIDIAAAKELRENCHACWAYNICFGSCKYCQKFAKDSMINFLCSNRKKEAELACWMALLCRQNRKC